MKSHIFTIMAKIPFKVSARTARLIGRENIASSRGAIVELVKNSSDADANTCIVFFDNKYGEVPTILHQNEYQYLVSKGVDEKVIDSLYDKIDDQFHLRTDLDEASKLNFLNHTSHLNHLYIIDDGDGMTQEIIENYWMTIGTDNKLQNVFTKKGRVKAGAKGIGRFALDKLGDFCELTTKYNPEVHKNPFSDELKAFLWQVRWSDFEGHNKTIDKVEAELIGLEDIDLKNEVKSILEGQDNRDYLRKSKFSNGTIIDISDLRDTWSDYFVSQVFSDLEVLVPPEESGGIRIFLFSSLRPAKYGLLTGSVCDDYDYKLVARADKDQNIVIEIFRNEYDVETIDASFFERNEMQSHPYRLKDFKKGKWKRKTTFSQLLPGFSLGDNTRILDQIGEFEFTFYFMKRGYSTLDQEKYFYRPFISNARKDWLDRFGGVKIFRDGFRVRPYGEVGDVGFDWLSLGARKASSPASPSKEGGGYKVEPDNVAGTIKISRLSNLAFQDKSSREGLQESRVFSVFNRLIEKIIRVLEEDRSYIARQMHLHHGEKTKDKTSREQAEKLAQDILDRKRSKTAEETTDDISTDDQSPNEIILSELVETQKEEIEKLVDEQKILRGLASSGIVVASFNHELSNLKDVLGSRMDELKELLGERVKPEDYSSTADFDNPFILIEDIKDQDLKMRNWLKFSIGAARKDKRYRKKINLTNYFQRLENTWRTVLDNRFIKYNLVVATKEDVDLRVFEIDLDSIFNNLIVNSIDAFLNYTNAIDREIAINLSTDNKNILINYIDNGPGLSQDIENPAKIFEALFTTKIDYHTGEEIGTGLGMWLVKTIVKDNDGRVQLLNLDSGFGLRISFPKKYRKKPKDA